MLAPTHRRFRDSWGPASRGPAIVPSPRRSQRAGRTNNKSDRAETCGLTLQQRRCCPFPAARSCSLALDRVAASGGGRSLHIAARGGTWLATTAPPGGNKVLTRFSNKPWI